MCAVFDELSNDANLINIVLIQCIRDVNVPERPRIMTHTSYLRCESENFFIMRIEATEKRPGEDGRYRTFVSVIIIKNKWYF